MPELAIPLPATSIVERPIGYEDLSLPFASAEKDAAELRLGVEAEKFGVILPQGVPVPYEGQRSISQLLGRFLALGFEEQREKPGGPVIALERDGASITLEPGAQLELSGAPQRDLHAANAELQQHLTELAELSSDLGIAWCSVGFHPLARQDELPWVPKLRYAIMREYLPGLGDGALDMMRRTATVQVNLDYVSEADAMRKLRVMLRLSPLVHAMTSHSPVKEGQLVPQGSLRGDVWTRMDPARTGLLGRLWSDRELSYWDYIEWALDAGMFLIKRDGEVVANTGQTFRDFLRHGYHGHYATMSDWKLHLNTMFPEVRLKNTLEARSADAQPADTLMSVPALWVGLMYDAKAFAQAEALANRYGWKDIVAARPALIEHGLGVKLGPYAMSDLALELLAIARDGLAARGRRGANGRDETAYLEPLAELLHRGETPADRLRRQLKSVGSFEAVDIVAMTRVA